MSKDGREFQQRLIHQRRPVMNHSLSVLHHELLNLPTNSGVPKMFLNSTPSLILCAKPKSISLIRGSWMLLSRSMMFSGWKTIKLPIKSIISHPNYVNNKKLSPWQLLPLTLWVSLSDRPRLNLTFIIHSSSLSLYFSTFIILNDCMIMWEVNSIIIYLLI